MRPHLGSICHVCVASQLVTEEGNTLKRYEKSRCFEHESTSPISHRTLRACSKASDTSECTQGCRDRLIHWLTKWSHAAIQLVESVSIFRLARLQLLLPIDVFLVYDTVLQQTVLRIDHLLLYITFALMSCFHSLCSFHSLSLSFFSGASHWRTGPFTVADLLNETVCSMKFSLAAHIFLTYHKFCFLPVVCSLCHTLTCMSDWAKPQMLTILHRPGKERASATASLTL